jgi:hypothetical protein
MVAIADLDVGEPVILFRQRQQRLRQHLDALGVDRELAPRCPPHHALDADDVAEIDELHQCELIGREKIFVAEDLDLARSVVQVDEHAAVADGADAPGDRDTLAAAGAGREPRMPALDRLRLDRAREAVGVGVATL